MADSGNNSSPLRAAYSQKGTYVDLKAKLKKAEVVDGVMTQSVKWLAGRKNTTALIFDEVEEGGPLHQCGISNGDELTTVNHTKVDCSLDVNHIASVIRDCSPTVMLGIKRRRVVGSVQIVVIFHLSDADSNPVHRFCGFYWGILPKDIPFIPVSFDSIETYAFSHTQPNVEVIAQKNNVQNWLTFNNGEWTFEPARSASSKFVIYVYTQTSKAPVPLDTPVIFVPQHDQSYALDATINDDIEKSPFSSTHFRGNNIPGSGVFLKVFGVENEEFYHIKSSQTSSLMEAAELPNGPLVPIMSSNPTLISLLDSTTGNHISL